MESLLKAESVRPEKHVNKFLHPRRAGELTGKEAVQLHKQLNVDIVAFGSLAVRAAHMVLVQIDTFETRSVSE